MGTGRREQARAGIYSFVLVKPDGVARELDPAVEAAMRAEGLRVICRHDCSFSPLPAAMWRLSVARESVFDQTLLEREFSGRPIRYYLVQARDALARTRRVKAAIRQRYARGPFANVLHAPDDPQEWGTQLSVLGASCPRCCAVLEEARLTLPHGFARPAVVHAPERAVQIAAIVRRWWDDETSPVWRPESRGVPVCGDPALADTVVTLRGCDRVPGDVVIDALVTHAGVALDEAVCSAMRAAHQSTTPLVRTSGVEAARLVRVLRARYRLDFRSESEEAPPGR